MNTEYKVYMYVQYHNITAHDVMVLYIYLQLLEHDITILAMIIIRKKYDKLITNLQL